MVTGVFVPGTVFLTNAFPENEIEPHHLMRLYS